MEFDKTEVRNYLIKRLVDAEAAIMEIHQFINTKHNREAQYPNVFTRIELTLEAIGEIRREMLK